MLSYNECDNFPTSNTFVVTSSASIEKLVKLTQHEISFILPTLGRAASCKHLYTDNTSYIKFKNEVKKVIRKFDEVNFIQQLLEIDFNTFKDDIMKNQQLRSKHDSLKIAEEFPSNLNLGLALEYEKSTPSKKMRMIVTEILRIMGMRKNSSKSFTLDETELFQCEVYVDEISNALCIAFTELPFLLPITEVAEALLTVKHGPWILCKLLVNNPECFEEVCSSILKCATSSDESEMETRLRMNTLTMLCQLNPSYKKMLRTESVSLCKLAGLSIELSINHENTDSNVTDLVPFFTGLFLAGDVKTKEWFAEYIKTAQRDHKENALTSFKKQLLKEMKDVIKSLTHDHGDMEVDNDESNHIMHGITIMRLFCSLKSMSGFKFSTDEAEVLLDLITSPTPFTSVGIRYVSVAICTMVACSFLISTVEREETVKNWLRKLIEQSSSHHHDSEISYGEILLLIAIHFHSNQLEPIVDLICSTLGIKVKAGSLTKIKILFTQEVFQEKIVAEHAVTVQVTKNLSKTHINGFLPAHCILQLMKSGIFTKHDIPVREWLFKQLCSCSTPIHPIMIELIDAFVHSIIFSINISKTKHQRMVSLQPLTEEDILSVFNVNSTLTKHCDNSVATKILIMFYVLKYQDILLSNIKTLINNPKAPRQYSTHLYSTIPMKQLLLKARADEGDYGILYPPLLKLLTIYYPQLCLVEDWIVEEEISFSVDDGDVKRTNHECENKAVVSLEKNLSNMYTCPQKLVLQMSKLICLTPNELLPYENLIVQLLPKLLDSRVPRKLQMVVCKAWIKLNMLIPNSIWYKTVNSLHKQPEETINILTKPTEYTDEEIQRDPLIVLRCDLRVYRCPPLFDIVLRVLNAYLTASKSSMNHHLLSNPIILGNRSVQEILSAEKERDELKKALIAAQESAAIQILLEVCLPTVEEKTNECYSLQSLLREIQCICCSYIHQSFIKDPTVAKLIHFQGYPAELLSMTVAGVPSIHICLDFIPELLNQTHLEKQLFAVQLTSHLAVQYPIPKSYSISKHVVDRLCDLLLTLPTVKRNQFFVPSLTCLLRISKAFPPLREDITDLLLKLGKIANSQLDKNAVITAVPCVSVKAVILPDDIDDGMECDDNNTNEGEISKININQLTLSGDNPAYNRSTELKPHTSMELISETKKTFVELTNLCFSDKLVLIDSQNSNSS